MDDEQDQPGVPSHVPGPEVPSRTRRGRWPFVLVGLVVVVVLLGLIGWVVTRSNDRSQPSAWDPVVADLAPFVEAEKGSRFLHPVRVVLLDEEAFRERVTTTEDDLSEEDREGFARTEAQLRALGLHGGTGSLFDQVNTMQGEGVAAFYDPDREEIVVPWTGERQLAMQSTLVHELTHVLQDQLGQLEEPDDSDAAAAFKALVEGEAEHISTAWSATLADDEVARLDEESSAQSDEATSGLGEVNPVLVALFSAPYSIGEPMVDTLADAGRVEHAFEDPPQSFADVQDPKRWLAPVDLVAVEPPALADTEKEQGDEDTFGATALYLMLATELDPTEALTVADGWGGDRMRSYTAAGGTECVRVAMVGVDDAATATIAEAVSGFVASRPSGSASSSVSDGVVTFDACDPGTEAPTITDAAANTPAVRAAMVGQLRVAGLPIEHAACAGDQLLTRVSPDVFLLDELPEEVQRELAQAVQESVGACAD